MPTDGQGRGMHGCDGRAFGEVAELRDKGSRN